MPSIGCSRVHVQGQISSPTSGAQVSPPNHKAKRGKHLCTHHLRHIRPSLQQRWFHGYPASLEALWVPRLCAHYVHQQPDVLFENQGLSAKIFHQNTRTHATILVFLPTLFSPKRFCGTFVTCAVTKNVHILDAGGHAPRNAARAQPFLRD